MRRVRTIKGHRTGMKLALRNFYSLFPLWVGEGNVNESTIHINCL